MRCRRIMAGAVASLALILAGCSAGGAGPSATGTHTARSPLSGTVTVLAAASLTGAFDKAAQEFETVHPGVHVMLSYDGSSTLATQIIAGAPADVFASADEANMDDVTDEGLTQTPVVFARNVLTIVVPKGDPAHVRSLADLADPATSVVLCAKEVPCGAASQTLLARAGVEVTARSYEQNVTAVLTKVRTGEADAGLVYVTDAATTDQVVSIETEGASDVVNEYPIAVLRDASNRPAAQAFTDFITGEKGQKILASFGFEKP